MLEHGETRVESMFVLPFDITSAVCSSRSHYEYVKVGWYCRSAPVIPLSSAGGGPSDNEATALFYTWRYVTMGISWLQTGSLNVVSHTSWFYDEFGVFVCHLGV